MNNINREVLEFKTIFGLYFKTHESAHILQTLKMSDMHTVWVINFISGINVEVRKNVKLEK